MQKGMYTHTYSPRYPSPAHPAYRTMKEGTWLSVPLTFLGHTIN